MDDEVIEVETAVVCATCETQALSLAEETGVCCAIGSLESKLRSLENRYTMAFRSASEKSLETVQPKQQLGEAQSKVDTLKLKVQALEEQVKKQQSELEASKKKIAELSVETAAQGVQQAMTDVNLEDSLSERRSKLQSTCVIVDCDKSLRKLRYAPETEFDLHGELAGNRVFGEFRVKQGATVAEVVSNTIKFLEDFPNHKIHLMVHVGAKDVANGQSSAAPVSYDDIADRIIKPLAELKAGNARILSVTWCTMIESPDAHHIRQINERITSSDYLKELR